MVKYRELEPQYTKAEKRKAESLEGYKEGYEQAVERTCMDAQEDFWTSETAKLDQISYQKRTPRSPDFPEFDEVYNEEEDEWEFSEEDQEWIRNFWDGWNAAHTKHYNIMLKKMESLQNK